MNGLIGIFGLNITQYDRESLLSMQKAFSFKDNIKSYQYNNLILSISAPKTPEIIPLYNNNNPSNIKIHIDGSLYSIDDNRYSSIEELYHNLGPLYPNVLSGIFNGIILDEEKKLLHLSKDHLGQKALYYFKSEEKIVFSSSLACLKLHPKFPKEISPQAVSDYLSFLYVPSNVTIYKKVKTILPGNTKTFSLDNLNEFDTSYWQLSYANKVDLSYQDACSKFTSILDNACNKRINQLPKLNFFLSGGIDSTLIASLVASKNNLIDCQGFTVGFNNPAYDERHWAKLAANFIKNNFNSNFTLLEKELPVPAIEDLISAQKLVGQPYSDASLLPCIALSKFAGQSTSICLGGDGADEFFASYERYIAMSLVSKLNFVPSKVKRAFFLTLANLLPDSGERSKLGRLRRFFNLLSNPSYFNLIDKFPCSLKSSIFGDNLKDTLNTSSETFLTNFSSNLTSKNIIERLSELDIHTYLTGDIFTKSSTSSAIGNIEVRSPFLDKNVIEFLASLPLEYKLKGMKRKRLLQDSYPQHLPLEIIQRPKKGFGVPIATFLRNNWKNEAKEILFNGKLLSQAYINKEGLLNLWNNHQNGNRDYSYQLYSLLNLSIFLENNQ
jgi:asparagine synthase (glutamine-hydrolysing)